MTVALKAAPTTVRRTRLQAGDIFRFAAGTRIDIDDRVLGKYDYDPKDERYVVIEACASTGGERMGLYSDNGGWTVKAAPAGTTVERLHLRTVQFYQDGPYRRDAIVGVTLVEENNDRSRLNARRS